MGSPSRNVQYHPPRLSEDRLNLPQPHSPSLPTHCSGKSGMRPLYLFDAGVFRSLRPKGPFDRPEEIDGQALEGLVAQHLRAWVAYSTHDVDLFFWRTRAGTEIDFVVYGETGLQAFEVKNAGRVHSTRPAGAAGVSRGLSRGADRGAVPRPGTLADRRRLVPAGPGLPAAYAAGPRSAGLAVTRRRQWLYVSAGGTQPRPCAAATAACVTCPSTTLTPFASAGSCSAAARQPRSAISSA